MWFLYIIQTENNKLYTGISTDYERRFVEHLTGFGGAKFFRGNEPKRIVYLENFNDRSSASIAESLIKKLSRKQKESLILRFFPNALN